MERTDAAAEESLAAILARIKLGIAIAAMIRMIATTISSSISEKPFCFRISIFPSYVSILKLFWSRMTQSGLMLAFAGPNLLVTLVRVPLWAKGFIFKTGANFGPYSEPAVMCLLCQNPSRRLTNPVTETGTLPDMERAIFMALHGGQPTDMRLSPLIHRAGEWSRSRAWRAPVW